MLSIPAPFRRPFSAEPYSFSVFFLLEKNENKQKEAEVGPLKTILIEFLLHKFWDLNLYHESWWLGPNHQATDLSVHVVKSWLFS